MPSIPAPWEPSENQAAEPVEFAPPAPTGPQWTRIGSSVRGKPIRTTTIGSGPRRIYVIGGMHGDEPEGPAAAAILPEIFEGVTLESATIRILADMNPDGTAARTRYNTRGVDLNRNWPAKDYIPGDGKISGLRAASELETVVVHKDLAAFKPDVVIVITSSVRGPVIGFEGQSQMVAYEFAAAARREEPRWRLVPDRWKPSPGSAESYAWLNLKKPVLSVELRRGEDPETNAAALRSGLLAVAAMPELQPPRPRPASTPVAKPRPAPRPAPTR